MDFKKFIQENKNAISELARRNSKYDVQGHALLTKEDIEEECWDKMYKELSGKEVENE